MLCSNLFFYLPEVLILALYKFLNHGVLIEMKERKKSKI